MTRRELSRLALALVVSTVILLPNVVWPYSEDAALFAAEARFRSMGLALYRDVFEQKPPDIVMIEQARIALFGASALAARLFEVAFIVVGAAAAAIAARAFVRRASYPLALVTSPIVFALLASSVFWGLLERGMVEVYQAVAVTIGLALLAPLLGSPNDADTHTDRAVLLRCWGAGVVLAFACWLKPQAALIAATFAVVALIEIAGSRRRRVGGVAALAVGAVTTSLPIVVGLVWRGEWRAFVQVMTEFNAAYLASAPTGATGPLRVFLIWNSRCWAGLWISFAATLGLGLALRSTLRRDIGRGPLVLLIMLLVWPATQFATGGFGFPYHAMTLIPALALLVTIACAHGVAAVTSRTRGQARWSWLAPSIVAAAGASILATSPNFRADATDLRAWIAGRVTRGQLYAQRGIFTTFFNYAVQREAARVVATRCAPEESFYIFGRGAVTYLFAGRRPASRHIVSTSAYFPPGTASLIHEELVRDLTTAPPKLLLVRTDDATPWFGISDPSSVLLAREPTLAPFVALHYRAVGRVGTSFIVLERCPGDACSD